MRVTAVFLLSIVLCGCAVCRTTGSARSKEEIAEWCVQNREAIRFVGYQGSDTKQHNYVVRIRDSWTFFHIQKEELVVKDERPFPSASSAQMYYYLVDPLRDFAKLEEAKRPLL